MNNERYNQIIDEAYENYITQIRIEFEKWCQQNPGALVNYREDTRELFLKSIKEDKHWFTSEKNFSEKWGLKIEERELSEEERYDWYVKTHNKNLTRGGNQYDMHDILNTNNCPAKLITITYKDEKIEVFK
jgi:hypothetical protein